MIRKFISVCSLLSVLLISSQAHADVFVPDGLNPGDEYHLVFVTEGSIDATSADIGVYNDFVQAQAAMNAPLTGTAMGVMYSAIASTPSVAANANALIEAPVYLLDGTPIATGYADMWDGVIAAPINLTQFQLPNSNQLVWTGSIEDGTQAPNRELGNISDMARYGLSSETDGGWINELNIQFLGFPLHLYAVSETLTVPSAPPITVSADTLTVDRGNQTGGTLADTTDSDDSYVSFQPGLTLNSKEAPVRLIFDGSLPSDSPNNLDLVLESSAVTGGMFSTTLEAWNWNTNSYDVVDVSNASVGSDTVTTVDLTSDHVESGTGAVRSRVGWRLTGFAAQFPWEVQLDQLVWILDQ